VRSACPFERLRGTSRVNRPLGCADLISHVAAKNHQPGRAKRRGLAERRALPRPLRQRLGAGIEVKYGYRVRAQARKHFTGQQRRNGLASTNSAAEHDHAALTVNRELRPRPVTLELIRLSRAVAARNNRDPAGPGVVTAGRWASQRPFYRQRRFLCLPGIDDRHDRALASRASTGGGRGSAGGRGRGRAGLGSLRSGRRLRHRGLSDRRFSHGRYGHGRYGHGRCGH
jgi:hypothetical protein